MAPPGDDEGPDDRLDVRPGARDRHASERMSGAHTPHADGVHSGRDDERSSGATRRALVPRHSHNPT